MRTRWLAALGLGVLASRSPAVAQQPSAEPSPRSISVFEPAPVVPSVPCAECERPTELPPLLAVPPANPPRPAGPRGPSGEYDPGYFYLPERAPDMMRADPPCGPAGRVWVTPALETGWSKPAHVPALVRIGSQSGPVVYGDEHLRSQFRAGFSIAGGFWLDDRHTHGFDGSFYFLSQGANETNILTNAVPLVLPTANGVGFPLADPAVGSLGDYQAGLMTRFYAADANYRQNLLCGENGRLDGLVGYRYAHVGETYEIYGKRLGATGEIERFRDDAFARNDFHGGQVGLAGEYRIDRWYVSATGKVAFGTMFTSTDLDGKFRVNGVVVPSGFYARPGVNGDREHTRFGVMPTVGVALGRHLGEHSRVFVGYNFLYLTGLTRGPDVLDPLPSVVAANPQATQPVLVSRRDATTSDFWVQSLSFGMEWRY